MLLRLFLRVAVRAFSRIGAILDGDDSPGLSVLARRAAVDLGSGTGHLRAAPSARHAEEDVYASPARCAAAWAAGGDPAGETLGGGQVAHDERAGQEQAHRGETHHPAPPLGAADRRVLGWGEYLGAREVERD